ncbi:hypothetical protein [Pontibacter sp. HSC-36F09]|uniref:hypothetical protein n=1 Tax=Pontibacter sp. HSC-36F09 TaxID=2910966 RepID=UPI00209D2FF5|nr:hypothetical protein [Pontibacter sp. HSC-36F09]MCP2045744.1 hypothetical protein [Pontibacter sp. HSC-36F09]
MISTNIDHLPSSSTLGIQLPVAVHVPWRIWGIWWLVLVLVFTVFFASIDFAPILFQDEVMNVDLGRTILNADTDWSIAWMANENRPVFLLSYVGPVLQEFAYLSIGEVGPRVSGLVGAFVAATAIVGWLLARGLSYKVSFILGIVFLLDPLFVQAYTTARVDGWTMALCISSCWILRTNALGFQHEGYNRLFVVISGALTALAFFVWPSAVFLFPLILLELFYRANRLAGEGWNLKLWPFLYFGIGGFIMGGIMIIPIALQVIEMFESIVKALIINVQPGNEIRTSYLDEKLATSLELLRVLKFTPVLFLTAIFGAFQYRQIGLGIACLTATALLISTVVYISRVQYLLPYFILAASVVYQLKEHPKTKPRARFPKMAVAVLTLLVAWPVAFSFFSRTMVALGERGERDSTLMHKAAISMIGTGEHTVALFSSFEFYYAGRSIG